MEIELIGHDFNYEVDNLINLFFEHREHCNYKIISILECNGQISSSAKVFEDGMLLAQAGESKKSIGESELELKRLSKRLVKKALFKALKETTGRTPSWGILTGIRPTKIVHEMFEESIEKNTILNILIGEYEISLDKAGLLIEIAERELEILKNTPKDSISLYVGIPFCPTRCLYCSFTSNSMQKYSHLMDSYLEALFKEIESTSRIIREKGWTVQTIYVGGGTPTSLSEKQLEQFLSKLDIAFDLKNAPEVTVEAGRPDTITREKLETIKGFGIERISINPQTMNKDTLDIIKRMHTPRQIIESFNLAREIGFNNINMDLIVGLPGEREAHAEKTMAEIEKLSPDSLTVHTMAIKRAADLKQSIENYRLEEAHTIENMLEITRQSAAKMGMGPYYMYRQKNMLGNFENVGYAKSGKECIYNVQIMEEKQSIIALGAGATSKTVDLESNRIERIFNVKNVEEYINRVDEMIERKRILY